MSTLWQYMFYNIFFNAVKLFSSALPVSFAATILVRNASSFLSVLANGPQTDHALSLADRRDRH